MSIPLNSIRRFSLGALAALALLATGATADAQGVITFGNARWEYNSTTGSADFQPEATNDDTLFRQWFWWRIDGDPSESILSVPTAQDYTGNVATLDFSEANFDVQVQNTLIDDLAPLIATVTQTITITNTSAGDLDLQFFAYADFDVLGAGADSASLDGPMTIRVEDSGGRTVLWRGIDADNYRVTNYNEIATDLDNGTVTNFADTGLPFGPADFVGGFQWGLSIPDTEAVTLTVIYMTGPAGITLPPLTVGDEFLRGDSNDDGVFDISDSVYSLAALFIPGSPQHGCEDSADVNDDGVVDISDSVFALAALFIPLSDPPPSPGSLACGEDPTDDALECLDYVSCP